MAPPVKPTIRLTFLWADEGVMADDFKAGYSQTLIDWADDFYGRYGFQMNVSPLPGGDPRKLSRYWLSDTKGAFEPDMTTAIEFAQSILKLKKPFMQDWLDAGHDAGALSFEESNKRQEIRAALHRFGTLPQIEWPAQLARVTGLLGELRALADKHAGKTRLERELKARLDEIDRKFEKEAKDLDYDTRVRLLIGEKMQKTRPLGLLTGVRGRSEYDIVDRYRLKIVFCRFKLSPSLAKETTPSTPQPHGGTRPGISANSVDGRFMFSGPFTLINVERHEPITLAHEMIHAAGRPHKPDFNKMKNLLRWLQEVQRDPATRHTMLPPLYERVDGGYYDDARDSILNYNSIGKKPEQVVLYDKPLLERAYFVKEPPADEKLGP